VAPGRLGRGTRPSRRAHASADPELSPRLAVCPSAKHSLGGNVPATIYATLALNWNLACGVGRMLAYAILTGLLAGVCPAQCRWPLAADRGPRLSRRQAAHWPWRCCSIRYAAGSGGGRRYAAGGLSVPAMPQTGTYGYSGPWPSCASASAGEPPFAHASCATDRLDPLMGDIMVERRISQHFFG
jgi:hypothetical protein